MSRLEVLICLDKEGENTWAKLKILRKNIIFDKCLHDHGFFSSGEVVGGLNILEAL